VSFITILLLFINNLPLDFQNVLLTRDNPPQVKVADFGLAKLVNNLTIANVSAKSPLYRDPIDSFLFQTMCGTPSYLAPEVVLQVNQEGYDNLVDSWSVGTIVFAMYAFSIFWPPSVAHSLVSRLTNVAPFNEDKTQQDIRIRIATRTVEWSALDERDLSFDGLTPSSETIYFDLHHS
jgi:serine/threonine/tyrosine protein kinase RAD53